MKHVEKKYHVNDFDEVKTKLDELGAKLSKTTTSTHYYAQLGSNDVTKLVVYSDRSVVHILKESNGTFTLTDSIPVNSTEEGLRWMKDHGYAIVGVVKMRYSNYEFQDGIVGLYTINDSLLSIILDFTEDQHNEMEQTFELANAEVIEVPYNKYLDQVDKLEAMEL